METRKRNIHLAVAMAEEVVNGRQLAQRANLTQATVSRILNRRQTCRPSTAGRIAKALDRSPADLFPDALGIERRA